MASDDVLFSHDGALGRITLNRPGALNALTKDMCAAMLAQLRAWADDPRIDTVLIDAVPGRAFCAGGDIKAIYEWGRQDPVRAMPFFATEYRLNAMIKRFPKPYVALIDGIAMGGGVGVSVHGSRRVVTQNALFAMPETAIGLFPDVGGSYFLPRLSGALGMYLALTGLRLSAADMLFAGIATDFLPLALRTSLAPRLAQGEGLGAILGRGVTAAQEAPLAALKPAIDRAFAAPSVEAILDALAAEGEWGRRTASLLLARSPTSLKLTFRQMKEGAQLDFEACLKMEYRMMAHVLQGHDFYEGVRAQVIDKDQRPRWHPDRLADVSDADIAAYFQPLDGDELRL